MRNQTTKKVAIVYDWIDKWGGVERILLRLHQAFPEAVFYTSYFDKDKAGWAKDFKIKTSFLQKFPNFVKKSRILSFVFYPFAFESFNFSDYDLVISVTSSFAKSIITKPGTKHICYLLTPTRYLWSHEKDYLNNKLFGYLKMIKKWDYIAAQRSDKIISISETVRKRCLKYYRRNSEVIYPPFDIKYWENIKLKISAKGPGQRSVHPWRRSPSGRKNQKFFLVVSRLELYKKVDLVIRTFNKLKTDLVIVGEGTEEKKLKQIAGNNITFLSKLSDIELGTLYSNAQALIMPQEEDFGYVSLEAQLFDCPVIAYKCGGATETVLDGKTGLFFNRQEEIGLNGAIERFNRIKYNLKKRIRKYRQSNLERFSSDKLISNFLKL